MPEAIPEPPNTVSPPTIGADGAEFFFGTTDTSATVIDCPLIVPTMVNVSVSFQPAEVAVYVYVPSALTVTVPLDGPLPTL